MLEGGAVADHTTALNNAEIHYTVGDIYNSMGMGAQVHLQSRLLCQAHFPYNLWLAFLLFLPHDMVMPILDIIQPRAKRRGGSPSRRRRTLYKKIMGVFSDLALGYHPRS